MKIVEGHSAAKLGVDGVNEARVRALLALGTNEINVVIGQSG
jgi:hypothetical protein